MAQSQWTAGPAPVEAWTPGAAPSVSSQIEETPKPLNTRERVVSGAFNALIGMGKTAVKASGVPGLFREGPIGAIKDQAAVVKQLFYDPPAEMLERARNADTSGEQQAYSAAALLPVVGPIAGHIGTEIAEGRTPEAAGEVLAGAVLPFVPKGAKAALRRGSAAASRVGGMVPSGASAALLGRAAKYAAKQVIPPILVEGADLALNALRKNAVTGEAPAVTSAPRSMVDDPPAPIPEPAPVVTSVPAPIKAQTAAKATAPKKSAADQLMDKMSTKELTRVRKALGTQDVKIARYEPQRDSTGKFLGVSDPVYVMPAEFLEQAQMMGLRARGHTALEQSYRGPSVPRPVEAPVAAEASPEPTVSLNRERHRAETQMEPPAPPPVVESTPMTKTEPVAAVEYSKQNPWYKAHGEAIKEKIFTKMRAFDQTVERARERAERLAPGTGEKAVGASHFDAFMEYDSRRKVLSGVREGLSPPQAAAKAKEWARSIVKEHNSKRNDPYWKRNEEAADRIIEEAAAELEQAMWATK